jgi:hypothetical protein
VECQYEYTNTTAKSFDAPANGIFTLTFDAQQRQLLLMALGELLSSVTREEHLTPALQELLARVQAAQAASEREGTRPDRTNRTVAED